MKDKIQLALNLILVAACISLTVAVNKEKEQRVELQASLQDEIEKANAESQLLSTRLIDLA